jgi:hypothetical protein
MKRLAALALAAGTALGVGAAGASTASAAPTTFGQVLSVKIDKSDPTLLHMRLLYRCTTESHQSPHSFISAKQVGSGRADQALRQEGSSQLAIESGGAWAMSHHSDLNCDGKVHVGVYDADQIETASFGVPVRDFKKGFVYTQFCIFDDNYPVPPEGTPEEEGQPYDANSFRLAL